MVTLPPADESILGACFHGHAEELDRLGLQPQWLEHPATREIVQAIFALSRSVKPVNILNVMALSRNVPREFWPPVREISMNGYGDVVARNALDAAKSQYVVRQANPLVKELETLLHGKPGEVYSYLPRLVSQLAQVTRTGEYYDARPSALAKKRVPTLRFKSRNSILNEMMSGGYRDMLMLYIGVTGQGKSTMCRTHMVDGILQQKKCLLFINERNEVRAWHMVMQGLSGLTLQEFEQEKGSTPQREFARQQWMEYVEPLLRVYPEEFYVASRIESNISWDKPDLVCVDYLRKDTGTVDTGKYNNVDFVGDMAYSLLSISDKYGVPIITGAQMSDQNAQTFVRFDNHVVRAVYGSARPGQAAQIVYNMKRDRVGLVGYFRSAKNNFSSTIDKPYRLQFDLETQIFDLGHHRAGEISLPPL